MCTTTDLAGSLIPSSGLLAGCGGPELLPHAVSTYETRRPAREGRRILVDSTQAVVTRMECERLVTGYGKDAGAQGQAAVRKRSDKLGSTMQPWCLDNPDGQGIVVHDARC